MTNAPTVEFFEIFDSDPRWGVGRRFHENCLSHIGVFSDIKLSIQLVWVLLLKSPVITSKP